ncbi:helix-turn-helix domain-containing protein [Cytophagaceae bacterium YF14B1]|uniref:Helix-turn-helix domain-containing protein n=1 Tax=Xanthocytophaga flava TaxID=3048013 RepID=A0AAE3U503_9BACT|nr:helix-turn-helix domain-containing protein [Xanthocytophaga flavus]MDJ1479791.1 helix-turn-helix domain-containing protein [Xanthocytophaga flavus]
MKPYSIQSIAQLHKLLKLPSPRHPLISIMDFEDITCFDDSALEAIAYNFYCIAIKKNFEGKMRYGQRHYDFDRGVMTFFAPKQVVVTEIRDDWQLEGQWLVFHPDFIQGYSLASEIHQFGFFSYAVNEALHLSEDEEHIIKRLFEDIRREYSAMVDRFSQDVIIKQLELLLSYCNRFYHRQFLTRKQGSDSLLIGFENLLDSYFENGDAEAHGLPGVSYFADRLNISRNYLSDMLRVITGQSAQQHIQQKVIEKAKELLTLSELSVAEIAYQLGFEYPQSLHKLFKKKTDLSPLEFRQQVRSK